MVSDDSAPTMNRSDNDTCWRSETTLSGLATPVRHRTIDKSRLQEVTSSPNWNDCSTGWHNFSSPLRQRSAERGSSRSIVSQWNDSLIKDARSQPCIATTDTWDNQPESISTAYEVSSLEPFIPPPPLLDFETANLLPPLGVDVSSPSDDLNFLSVESALLKQKDTWVQIPAQYATLRHYHHRNHNHQQQSQQHTTNHQQRSEAQHLRTSRNESPGSSNYATLRRPKVASNSSDSSWLYQHESASSSRADSATRKCTCGQKMRLSSSSSYAANADAGAAIVIGGTANASTVSGASAADDLSSIATLRRPVKRKGRLVPQKTSCTPKMETSVLLDKLLRAGALRPEDYLVLSRMERMIMANHQTNQATAAAAAAAAAAGAPSSTTSTNSRCKTPQNLSTKLAASTQPVLESSDLNIPCTKNMHLKTSSDVEATPRQVIHDRMSLASESQHSNHHLQEQQQHYQQQQQYSMRKDMSRKEADRLTSSSPMDYYSSSFHAGRRSSQPLSSCSNSSEVSNVHAFQQQQQQQHKQQQQQLNHSQLNNSGRTSSSSSTSTTTATLRTEGSNSGYLSAAYANRCPCCGSQSHSAGAVTLQHVCTLCGGGPHHYASKLPSATPTYSYLPTRQQQPQQQQQPQYPVLANNTELAKFTPQSVTVPLAVAQNVQQRVHRNNDLPNNDSRSTMAQQNLAQQQGVVMLQRSTSVPAQTIRSTQIQINQATQESQQHNPLHAVRNQVRLSRSLSRTETVKRYFKRSAENFFGLSESKEAELKKRWQDRRRRMAARRCGHLKEELDTEDHVESRDVVDGERINEVASVGGMALHADIKRKESVAKMTWDGLAYLATAAVLLRLPTAGEETIRSRSMVYPMSAPSSVDSAAAASALPPDVTMDTGGTCNAGADSVEDEVFFDTPPPSYEDVVDSATAAANTALQPMEFSSSSMAPRRESMRDPRSGRWRRVIESRSAPPTSLVDRLADNSNRRQFGMGIVGRVTGRSLRRSVMEGNKYLKKQLDSFEDHRPYFTYWTCTVQVLIMLMALITYGFGPVGFNLSRRSGLVLVTSLSLQQVDYYEPSNFWLGPRAADLIHLGAKYSPCMRPDTRIRADIEASRSKERQTACCIRNDNSGCVQTSRAECSDLTSTWKKWNVVQSGPGGRISGSVCGQDPNFCIEPASVAPFEWPDDITKWPKCRKKLPGLGSESKLNSNVVTKTTSQAEHMVCEVIGHPCCIGIHGECRIATREYCDFIKGYFHEEASLCSQVSCMNDVCGMLPFHSPDVSDQFYRLWTSLFLHAGIIHLAMSIVFQMIIMRDLEKLAGPLRTGIIYLGSGIFGNLASAIFVPYRAEVGPSGSHFGLIAFLCVEVLHAWPILRTPWRALGRLLIPVVILFAAGLLPWIDNFAHIFGFISGGLLSYTFLPFVAVGAYDRRRKLVLIGITSILSVVMLTALVLLLYVWPIQDSSVIQTLGYLNCIPLTRDFCAEQNIHFNKREIMIT